MPYQESRLFFNPDQVADLYDLHQKVLLHTKGNKSIAYGFLGPDDRGLLEVGLRAAPGIAFPQGAKPEICSLSPGQVISFFTRVRFVRQTRFGERRLTQEEAIQKCTEAAETGGFQASSLLMAESATTFYHKRLSRQTTLPYWVASGSLTVTDVEKATAYMIRGLGRSRGLGFGMILSVD